MAEAAPTLLRVTLDTNLLIDYWKQRPRRSATERLIELATQERVDLAVTRYIRDDVPREPLAARINELHLLKIGETGGLFTIGFSALGGPDVLGSQEFLDHAWTIPVDWHPAKGSRPSEADLMHLHAHHAQGRDVFLTWDNALREAADTFFGDLKMRVEAPDDFLAGGGQDERCEANSATIVTCSGEAAPIDATARYSR